MPSNPYNEQRDCFIHINKILTNQLKDMKVGLPYENFIKDLLLSFAVSQSMIENYIIRFYINAGLVTLIDGVLKYKK